jgi:hypothetical protein
MYDHLPWVVPAVPAPPVGSIVVGIAGLDVQDDEPFTPEPTSTAEERAERRARLLWAPKRPTRT